MIPVAFAWGPFYEELGRVAPAYLEGAAPELLQYIALEASSTDAFWSPDLEAALRQHWETAPDAAVRCALDVWLENVHTYLRSVLGPDYLASPTADERRLVQAATRRLRLRADAALLRHLVDAGVVGHVGTADRVTLLVQGVVRPYARTAEGQLVRAVAEPWLHILRALQTRWETAYQIAPHDWERIVAAAFDQAGFEEVTLTPRSGDHGRDVIAVRRGVGTVRILGSVKAYAPGHRVTHDDVRALAGVLSGDPQATKGILATTSDFAPTVRTDPILAPLIPYRVELMDGAALRAWLSELLASGRPVAATRGA
jgi:restriction system protein